MNNMLVSPLLKVSPDGPVSSISEDLIHLRQGELDGACGPYWAVSKAECNTVNESTLGHYHSAPALLA